MQTVKQVSIEYVLANSDPRLQEVLYAYIDILDNNGHMEYTSSSMKHFLRNLFKSNIRAIPSIVFWCKHPQTDEKFLFIDLVLEAFEENAEVLTSRTYKEIRPMSVTFRIPGMSRENFAQDKIYIKAKAAFTALNIPWTEEDVKIE